MEARFGGLYYFCRSRNNPAWGYFPRAIHDTAGGGTLADRQVGPTIRRWPR